MSGKRRANLTFSIGGALALAFGTADAAAATNVDIDPSENGSRLIITGEANDDAISVSLTDATITVTDTGPGGIAEADIDCVAPDATTVTCALNPTNPAPPAPPVAPVDQIFASLGDGVDSYTDTGPFRDGLNWGSGDKTISTGPGVDSTFVLGVGNDTVDAGAGDDSINQSQSRDGVDILDGGAGTDLLSYGGTHEGVSISIDGQPNDGREGEGDNAVGFERLFGTDRNDTLIGDDSANELFGGFGDDLLMGMGGSDGLIGNAGNDSLIGGGGRDDLACDIGLDSVVADPFDVVAGECERRGAEIGSATAVVKGKKGTAKLRVACPLEESAPCVGTVVLLSGGRQIGAGMFNVANGLTAVANAKLTKPGRKLLARNDGLLLVTAQAQTNEPLGVTVNDQRVLLSR